MSLKLSIQTPPFLIQPYQSISLIVCADRIMTCTSYELNATISAGVHILVFNVEPYGKKTQTWNVTNIYHA